MGATVVTGRNVGAFRTPSGHILYVLFERTYEKNCTPHTPHWCAVGFGSIRGVMRRIFELASECEGGMLQGPDARVAPESYLSAWFKELARPFKMPDQGHELFVGKGLYDTIQQDRLDKVRAALEQIGREDIASRLEAGERIPAWLYKDAGVVRALYGSGEQVMPAWLFLNSRPAWATADRDPKLGFTPSDGAAPASSFELPTVRAIADEEERLIMRPDGSFMSAGWSYSIVQKFIVSLWEEGLRSAKTCYERIEAYRAAVEDAPQISLDEFNVVVDTTQITEEWDRKNVAEILSRFQAARHENGFEITPTTESLYSLTRLPQNAARWLIQSMPSVAVVDEDAAGSGVEPFALTAIPSFAQPTVQLSLF